MYVCYSLTREHLQLDNGAYEAVTISREKGDVYIAGEDDEASSSAYSSHFHFNYTYPCEVETYEIYEEMVHPIVSHLFNGYNGTVFCYGQTG